MNDLHYTILAYVVGGGLLWGYAVYIWLIGRRARRRQSESPETGADVRSDTLSWSPK